MLAQEATQISVGSADGDSADAILRQHGIRLAGPEASAQSYGAMALSSDGPTQAGLLRMAHPSLAAAEPDAQSDSSASAFGGLLISSEY